MSRVLGSSRYANNGLLSAKPLEDKNLLARKTNLHPRSIRLPWWTLIPERMKTGWRPGRSWAECPFWTKSIVHCWHDHSSYRGRVDARHTEEECRPFRMDDFRYAGGGPGYHVPQAFGIKGSALGCAKEEKPWWREETRSQGRDRQALAVGFICEVWYMTWLTNVVMVTKPNDKWRMCVDYTNINKAFQKDLYPLPNIDWLVDGASGHTILNFLDAYSGYNQVSMHLWVKEKTAFVMDDANYYYRVMPFRLKNTGATYQRLMDKIFKGLIDRCVEVYVDNMVVKSDSFEQQVKDLEELFEALGRMDMRLNPEKYTFGVEGGKFLGFMLTYQGIEANSDKCRTIVEMRSSQKIKEVQQLIGVSPPSRGSSLGWLRGPSRWFNYSARLPSSVGTRTAKRFSSNWRTSCHLQRS